MSAFHKARGDAEEAGAGPGPDAGATATVSYGDGASPPAIEALPGPGRGSALGRYVVLDLIGAGGMGVVYAAYDPRLDRKVALKLLHPRPGATEERLLREAQALAKLNDPHVITVYDVGVLERRFFLAMEYVPGCSLKDWLEEKPRSRREVLDVFAQAGSGLAAAHEAGLVHRDFKPGNVMVRPDGRVLVLDFGLARAEGLLADPEESAVVSLEELRTSAGEIPQTPLEKDLTRSHAALGTPAYMAPEQRARRKAGAPADQYSFCLALYEALEGTLPNLEDPGRAAGGGGGLADETEAASRVPARLRRVLLRGLSFEPGDRHPSMRALLREISWDRKAAWRRWTVAVLLALLLGTAWLAHRSGRDRRLLCAGAAEKLAGAWDAGRRQAVAAAFLATGKPFARETSSATGALLDAYGEGWARMHTAACEATHVSGEQSPELLDRRVACLGQRRKELEALTDLFVERPEEMVEKAVQVVSSLSPLADCADTRALMAPVAPPADEASRRQVEALRLRLAESKALVDAGQKDRGLEAAREVAERARDLGYWPLTAEAWLRVGLAEEWAADAETAAATLRRALMAAEAGRHDRVAVESFVALVRINAYEMADFPESRLFADLAAALLEHLDERQGLEAALADHVGVLLFQEGRYGEAIERHRHALELREKSLGSDHPEVARTLIRLSNVLSEQGAFEEARAHLERALAVNERTLGAWHPVVATNLDRLGVVAYELADYPASEERFRRALEISRRLFGPEHPKVATVLIHLANVHLSLGDTETALGHYREALRIYVARRGADHPYVAVVLSNIGAALADQGHRRQALEHLGKALAIQEKSYGADHPWVARTVFNLGEVLNGMGDYAAALRHHERALAIWRGAQGEDYYWMAHGLTGLGKSLVGLSRPARAVPHLERALEIWATVERDPVYVAETRFELARALTGAGHDPGRALALAEEARAGLMLHPDSYPGKLEEIEEWLRARDPRGTDRE